jgi:protein TonB
MNYARQQRDPTRHVIGITFVVIVHAIVIYALVTGLARKAVEVIKKPLTATIVEELKAPPPPPPPPKKIIEAPKVKPPEAPYVPPPDIPVPTPTEAPPTITAVTPEPPPEQYVIAPPPPVVAPPAPPKPAIRKIGAERIAGENPEYPRAAIKEGVEKGRVIARLNIDEKGNVTDVIIVSAEPKRYFDRAVILALKDWKFRAEGEKYVGEVEINFALKD